LTLKGDFPTGPCSTERLKCVWATLASDPRRTCGLQVLILNLSRTPCLRFFPGPGRLSRRHPVASEMLRAGFQGGGGVASAVQDKSAWKCLASLTGSQKRARIFVSGEEGRRRRALPWRRHASDCFRGLVFLTLALGRRILPPLPPRPPLLLFDLAEWVPRVPRMGVCAARCWKICEPRDKGP
jgi:hypothetical protein